MTGVQIFIGGTEVVSDKNFTIKEEMLSASSTILNNCFPKAWDDDKDYSSRFFYPKDYSNCEIYRNSVLIFAGIVKNSGDISLRPTDPKYCSLQILDYKTLLSEGTTLDFVISNKTIVEAIQMTIEAVSTYGFIEGNIDILGGTEIIGAYSTLNKTAYDVFQYLAEISNSKWYTRMIDENTVAIDFYDPTLMPRADNLEYTTEFFEANNIQDISFSFGTRDYRNKQAILSDLVYGSIDTNENVISNGYSQTYNASGIIGEMQNVYVNGVAKTFATITEKNIGIYADFYYSTGSSAFESSVGYTAGTIINVIYTPLVKGRQVVYNNNEISRIGQQTGRNGIIARYETRNDILSTEELTKVAQTYIKYKGKAEISLTVVTKDTDLYNVGQQVYFDMPDMPDIATDYMVKTKEIKITQTGIDAVIFYVYTLSSNYESENAINYFDNQRRKASGNINESEFITRNIDIEKEANIVFNDLVTTEVVPDGDNMLNCILNSPFTN